MKKPFPGEVPTSPPDRVSRAMIGALSPYVREAVITRRLPWQLTRRRLFDFLLLHILDGTGTYRISDQFGHFSPGTLLWIPPDTLHSLEGYAPHTEMQYVHFDLIYRQGISEWLAYLPSNVDDLTPWRERIHPTLDLPFPFHQGGELANHAPSTLHQLLNDIVHQLHAEGASTLSISGLMLQVIDLIFRKSTTSHVSPEVFRMQKIRQELIQDCCDSPCVEQSAHSAGMCASQFRLKYRRQFGETPRETIINAKMKHAGNLLAYTSQTVSEIAFATGFANVHNFSRAFKHHIGCSPKQFRNPALN